MAWNIANLHHEIDEHLPGRPNAPARSQDDFDRIARIIEDLNPDIVALQEVNGPAAVRRVMREGDWEVVVADRFEEDLAEGRDTDHIHTAVAVRKNSPAFFIAGDTVAEIGVPQLQNGETRPTRRGTQVLVELPNGEPLQLMSVNLKSACHNGSLEPPRTDACRTLAKQREPLEAWIDELREEGTPFIIAGDWNRRIDLHGPGDHIWEELDDGEPFPLDLIRFPEGIASPCLKGRPDHFPDPIDFIVLDPRRAGGALGGRGERGHRRLQRGRPTAPQADQRPLSGGGRSGVFGAAGAIGRSWVLRRRWPPVCGRPVGEGRRAGAMGKPPLDAQRMRLAAAPALRYAGLLAQALADCTGIICSEPGSACRRAVYRDHVRAPGMRQHRSGGLLRQALHQRDAHLGTPNAGLVGGGDDRGGDVRRVPAATAGAALAAITCAAEVSREQIIALVTGAEGELDSPD